VKAERSVVTATVAVLLVLVLVAAAACVSADTEGRAAVARAGRALPQCARCADG
jgi:hypothetical protein